MPLKSASRVTRSSRSVSGHHAHRHRHRAVAKEAVELGTHVERHDVARLQRRPRRNPVHHLIVHRRAERGRVTVIPLERRLRPGLAHALLGQPVDLQRGHTRLDEVRELGEDARHQLAHPPQLRDLVL